MNEEFEKGIADLTLPINGQYPRPWMTSLQNPASAKVFIVGLNQATEYPESAISHDRHLNALFNRNGENCRDLYNEIRSLSGKNASPTRRNIDKLTKKLEGFGVQRILETDVICYSTKKYKDLADPQHHSGCIRGEQLFKRILNDIRPPLIIAHGVQTTEALGRVLGVQLPPPNRTAKDAVVHAIKTGPYMPIVLIVPSFSPQPGIAWKDENFDSLAGYIASMYTNYMKSLH